MPRTRSQQRAREGLLSLDDDALRNVLSFLSVTDGRRGAGVTSRALRQTVASQLARARATAPYVLRGNTHGVVHSLGSRFGTQQWPTRHGGSNRGYVSEYVAKIPPQNLEIRIERLGKGGPGWVVDAEDDRCFRSNIVDPHVDVRTSGECAIEPGSFVEYKLPFQLRISHFRLGYGHCGARLFKCFVFEAYDGETSEWRTLYEANGVSPWEDYNRVSGPPPEVKYFDVDEFTSTRFRIRLTDPRDAPQHLVGLLLAAYHGRQCMHLRAFELFGTVLPPWQV